MRIQHWLLLILLATGCAIVQGTAKLVDRREGKLTLRYFVGQIPDWYGSAFENGAAEQCAHGYDVLEKSYTPSTLTVFDDGFFYWVVKCRQ